MYSCLNNAKMLGNVLGNPWLTSQVINHLYVTAEQDCWCLLRLKMPDNKESLSMLGPLATFFRTHLTHQKIIHLVPCVNTCQKYYMAHSYTETYTENNSIHSGSPS